MSKFRVELFVFRRSKQQVTYSRSLLKNFDRLFLFKRKYKKLGAKVHLILSKIPAAYCKSIMAHFVKVVSLSPIPPFYSCIYFYKIQFYTLASELRRLDKWCWKSGRHCYGWFFLLLYPLLTDRRAMEQNFWLVLMPL